MAKHLKSTGNLSVDQMYYVPVQGDITPECLYKIIKKKDTGTTDFLAVAILSNIIYWHRPTIKYDEDGEIISVNKKFSGKLLQKSYSDYAELYDVTKRQVKAAFDTLEYQGFIKRHFESVKLPGGAIISNVMFIELDVPRLKESVLQSSDEGKEYRGFTVCHENDDSQNDTSEGTCQKDDDVTHFYVTPPTKKCDTYTNTNSNTISYISFTPSLNTSKTFSRPVERMTDEEAYREILKENVDLDSLLAMYPNDRERFIEYFEVMVDLVCFNDRPVRINGRDYPAEAVRSRMLKLNRDHLEYVCSVYDTYAGEITNFYKHCAATLYNSFFEVNNRIKTATIVDRYSHAVTA